MAIFNKFIYLLFLAALGLHCFARTFSSCYKWEQLFIGGAQASHLLQWRLLLQSTGSRHSDLSSYGVWASLPHSVCGIFLDQGSNLWPLNWQADSHPLHHQGSPVAIFKAKTEKASGKSSTYDNFSWRWTLGLQPLSWGQEKGLVEKKKCSHHLPSDCKDNGHSSGSRSSVF